MISTQVKVNHYDFENNLFENFSSNHFAKDLWPLVYILSDGETKTAYVGETTDAYSRMSTHLKHKTKSKLTSVHLITSEKFNKSATLDIESNLIKYISGDNVFKLLNGNLGLANHNYYQKKEVYWDIFNSVWNQLRKEGISKHSIEHIDNSDLFKYSPYKSLTKEQSQGLFQILQNLATGKHNNTIVEGGAGTGKTILAIFLFKMLSSELEDFNFKEFGSEEKVYIDLINQIKKVLPKPKMALVVPMSSFRTTLKKIFKNIKGLSASMVIGPAQVSKEKYDLLIVDESHRLRRRVNLGAYFGAFDKACHALNLDKHKSSELDWVTMQSKYTVLFYDESQSIKPSDAKKEDFDLLKKSKKASILKLKSQFRVKGGNAYVEYIDSLLHCRLTKESLKFNSKEYEFTLFDSLEKMIEQIKIREKESGLSRLIAGYSWEWKSNKNKDFFDIQIDNVQLKWNGTSNDWINSEGSINEVGCIHTTQGYDLNYSGIIFGNEISFNPKTREIIIKEESYFDKNGKQSIKDPKELKAFILNIYKTILLRGIKGTYVYVCDPLLREYFESFIPKFLTEQPKTIELFKTENILPFENAIPLYDLKVAAGCFGSNQQVEDMKWINIPNKVKPSKDLFACQVIGESMNKVIPNGSYCLFRKYSGGSRNGQIVLVESTNIHDSDFGSCYTIKEYESKKHQNEEGWKHQSIILKPLSTNKNYEKIVLEDEELLTFKVIGIFECVLK
ncbi:LexA repressor [Polaribacter huanghezhanensis]|uniref:DNA/RNA helicase domain-containing protein n=1 Tax=Polaribacter huanghezhanensis TaxID=1354726 RepID=UPI002647A19B|nr:DNA/RNA helicase domain-containing protein [Polaribacter huanghezhanensis]WKD86360.1 LexA repressor [Polaribacter huanghezhanensis]